MGYSRAMSRTADHRVRLRRDRRERELSYAPQQTRCALDRIRAALHYLEADLEHLVGVRIYHLRPLGGDRGGDGTGPRRFRPPNTLVEVSALIGGGPVEIEAEAWTG